jgi:ribosome maturation factor RimP
VVWVKRGRVPTLLFVSVTFAAWRGGGEVETAVVVQELVEPVLAAEGVELVDVSFSGGTLQLFVDRPGGIDLDAISALSTRVSRLLDDHDPIPGRYTLEVSSPGVERPLRRPDHFRRFLGSLVSVKTRPDVEGERRQQGRLQEADDEGIVVVAVDGPHEGVPRRLAYGEIDRARTVFEWGGRPKPGAPARRTGLGPRPGGETS